MRFRALTIAREFGSGGGEIARKVADALGWKLLDRELIEAVALAAHVDPSRVSEYDECVHSLLSRINRYAVRASAALSIGVVIKGKPSFSDEHMAELTSEIVQHAYAECHCVIVGRGAQCILRSKPDVFHAFIYASIEDRALRVGARLEPGVDIPQHIHAVDSDRSHYLKKHFGESWQNPHLYDLMLSSHPGVEATARLLQEAMALTSENAEPHEVNG